MLRLYNVDPDHIGSLSWRIVLDMVRRDAK